VTASAFEILRHEEGQGLTEYAPHPGPRSSGRGGRFDEFRGWAGQRLPEDHCDPSILREESTGSEWE